MTGYPRVESDGERFGLVERVRFGDLDAMQHMNNVEFLRYFETARIAYITSLLGDHDPTKRQEFGFIFAECLISYRSPAHYGEEIRTRCWPKAIGSSSVRLGFDMHALGEDRLVAEGYGVLVGYDYAKAKSMRLPEAVRERLGTDLR